MEWPSIIVYSHRVSSFLYSWSGHGQRVKMSGGFGCRWIKNNSAPQRHTKNHWKLTSTDSV